MRCIFSFFHLAFFFLEAVTHDAVHLTQHQGWAFIPAPYDGENVCLAGFHFGFEYFGYSCGLLWEYS
jgi:hypothetical protein